MAFSCRLSRRMFLAAACGLVSTRADAAPDDAAGRQVVIAVAGRSLSLTCHAGAGAGKRPAVLLLPGSRGLNARLGAYQHHAAFLVAAGIDAYVFDYCVAGELQAIHAAGSSAGREACYAGFVDGWVALIQAVADHVRQQPASSGKVGLLGFSLGGFVAVAAAGRSHASALAVFYGGLPYFDPHPVTALPPLLAIHGDADRNVPLSQGQALVAKARALGGEADLVICKGEKHGFDLDLGNRHSAPAMQAAAGFFRRTLAS